MGNVQPGILAPVPKLARYLNFSLKAGVKPRQALLHLIELADGDQIVVGVGQPTVIALGKTIAGLRTFPTHFGAGLVLPSTSSALWCWLRGHDRGDLLHQSKKLSETLSAEFNLDGVIDSFNYGGGRDLTGYEDGTENPQGKKPRMRRSLAVKARVWMVPVLSRCSSGSTTSRHSTRCRAQIRTMRSDGARAITKSWKMLPLRRT
jgi:deferrochelatase/peroxidase EfeB